MGSRKAPALPALLPPGGQPGGGQLGLHGFVRKMLCVYTPGRMKTQTPFGKIALHGRFEPKCRQGGFIKKKKEMVSVLGMGGRNGMNMLRMP